MRHDWILDVLTDLHAYACRNDLPGLADKVEAALDTALREISGQEGEDQHAVLRFLPRGRAN